MNEKKEEKVRLTAVCFKSLNQGCDTKECKKSLKFLLS